MSSTTTTDTAPWLPFGTVYQSPHSTDWHHNIAEDNTVLLTQVGSGLHGVHEGDQDDRDEMGVCIEPPEVSALVHRNYCDTTRLVLVEHVAAHTRAVGLDPGRSSSIRSS